jgi:hypothetical protein
MHGSLCGPNAGPAIRFSWGATSSGFRSGFRDWQAGRECFVYPASDALMASAPRDFDLVHAHNLHGDYFNLAALARASKAMPVVITLHDEWLMTGHCTYT